MGWSLHLWLLRRFVNNVHDRRRTLVKLQTSWRALMMSSQTTNAKFNDFYELKEELGKWVSPRKHRGRAWKFAHSVIYSSVWSQTIAPEYMLRFSVQGERYTWKLKPPHRQDSQGVWLKDDGSTGQTTGQCGRPVGWSVVQPVWVKDGPDDGTEMRL